MSISIGGQATASADISSISIGNQTNTTATHCIAIGSGPILTVNAGAQSTGACSVAVGGAGILSQVGGTCLADAASCTAIQCISIGGGGSAATTASTGTATANGASCTAAGAISIGSGGILTNNTASNFTVIGPISSGINAIAIGSGSGSLVTNASTPGANASALSAVAIGMASEAFGAYSIAIGGGKTGVVSSGASASTKGAISIGYGAATNTSAYNIAIGFKANTSTKGSIAIGYNATTAAQYNCQLGADTFISGAQLRFRSQLIAPNFSISVTAGTSGVTANLCVMLDSAGAGFVTWPIGGGTPSQQKRFVGIAETTATSGNRFNLIVNGLVSIPCDTANVTAGIWVGASTTTAGRIQATSVNGTGGSMAIVITTNTTAGTAAVIYLKPGLMTL